MSKKMTKKQKKQALDTLDAIQKLSDPRSIMNLNATRKDLQSMKQGLRSFGQGLDSANNANPFINISLITISGLITTKIIRRIL